MLRIWHCHSYGSSHCCSVGLIPTLAWELGHAMGTDQKKKKKVYVCVAVFMGCVYIQSYKKYNLKKEKKKKTQDWISFIGDTGFKKPNKPGVPSVAQWVENLTAAVRAAAESGFNPCPRVVG